MNDARRKLEERISRLGAEQRALLERRLKKPSVSGDELLAQSLRDAGVTHAFGVPGQSVYETYEEMLKLGIRVISTRHQQPGAMMAAAYNYFAGTAEAVTVLCAGAAGLNALTGLAIAHENGWPLVALAGKSPETSNVDGYFMSLPIREIFRPVTKAVMHVTSTADIPDCTQKAFSLAMSGRPGPVLVVLPENVLRGLITPSRSAATMPDASEPAAADPRSVQDAARAIATARRPLLIVGKGMRWADSPENLHRLVNELDLPFVTSPEGAGFLSEEHPLCLNAASWTAQEQADVLVFLGARLNWVFRYGNHINDDATLIQVDIHEPEIGRNRRPTIGVCADAGSFLKLLLDELRQMSTGNVPAERDVDWPAALQEGQARKMARLSDLAEDNAEPISPYRLAAEIGQAIPADAVTIFDGNLTMIACQQMIPARLPFSRLTAGTSGCLGIGIPYAMAAKLANPDRVVLAVCGDFAFGLNAMELETAVRQNIPIVVVIANNDGNSGARRQNLHIGGEDKERIMMFQSGLRYDQMMKTFGGHSEHVEHPEEIAPALQRALASQRPACINVRIDPHAPFPKK